MSNARFSVPQPYNEPMRLYVPGSTEREELKAELRRQTELTGLRIPLIIGGKEIHTDKTIDVRIPHNHKHLLATCSLATPKELDLAVSEALKAKHAWERMPWHDRAAIFLKVADLLSGPYRAVINAATMLGQGKTARESEVDAACELADFLRYNVFYAQEIYSEQPQNETGVWNRMIYRPLEGFVAAISPFNFTAIAGNLCTAPAILGNVLVWKPATSSVLSNYYLMKIYEEAGMPAGVINFVPSSGGEFGNNVLMHRSMAGLHFTGSTEVFRSIWQQIGSNLANYVVYPRLVGETGGKDFIFAHNSTNVDQLVAAMFNGAFEYQGQKCACASRAYVPESLWPEVSQKLLAAIAKLKVGDVSDFTNYCGAVIDKKAYSKICEYLDFAKENADLDVLCGGGYDDSVGWFIEPTLVVSKTPDSKLMVEEIFGPVLTVYVYADSDFEEALKLCDNGSEYALTGSIFAKERTVLELMADALSNAAGNLYINDKPTGSVVGRQPFGGARGSGTNDKAGSALNMQRWVSVQTVKESFNMSSTIGYPLQKEE